MRISDWSSDVCSSDLIAGAIFLLIDLASDLLAVVMVGFRISTGHIGLKALMIVFRTGIALIQLAFADRCGHAVQVVGRLRARARRFLAAFGEVGKIQGIGSWMLGDRKSTRLHSSH